MVADDGMLRGAAGGGLPQIRMSGHSSAPSHQTTVPPSTWASRNRFGERKMVGHHPRASMCFRNPGNGAQMASHTAGKGLGCRCGEEGLWGMGLNDRCGPLQLHGIERDQFGGKQCCRRDKDGIGAA